MLDLATETFALPIWAVAAIIALFAVATVLAFVQTAAKTVFLTFVRAGVVFIGVMLVVWIFLERTSAQNREAERRALDAHVSELAARAVAPRSPLACLDAIAGDAVETACEQALFASPEVVASALSYVSAKLSLLARGQEFANGSDLTTGSALLALRQSLESDRFGIVAQVLSLRDSCTPAQCDTFTLLHDTSRVRANLKDRTFDSYVTRYSASWSGRDGRAPLADATGSTGYTGTVNTPASNGAVATTVAGPAGAPLARPTMAPSRIDFPSASSIPAVSIMTPEPEGSAARTQAAPTATVNANGAAPQRKPVARTPSPPTRASQSVPAPAAPQAPAGEASPSLQ
jgi:hypothetical protein